MRLFSRFCLLVFTTLTLSCGSSSGPLPVATDSRGLPPELLSVMTKPRYQQATWSLLVQDIDTGEEFYALNAERLSFTGSTRKLFSTGLALLELGADHRFGTEVHRLGDVDGQGVLDGDLVLVASGDLTFGGRRIDADTVEFTDFDHNDANNLGTAILTPQDPLFALNQLAAEVKAAGVNSVSGEVVIDDRLFQSYRVPNGNLLITPIMLNENHVDVTVTPTQAGSPAEVEHRPATAYFKVLGQVETGAPGTEEQLEFSGDRLVEGPGTGTVSGSLPSDYSAPLSGSDVFVGTFRVEDPAAFARTAFIEALEREGVSVDAPTVAGNPISVLPQSTNYPADTLLAEYLSAPYSQTARLILKVSLNLGANTALSLFGLERGERSVTGALAVERQELIERFAIDEDLFNFPTNGSGSPDSEAAPRALVKWLVAIRNTPVGEEFQLALPILGVDGSLAGAGTTLPARGKVFAKTGTTIGPDENGDTQLRAQCLAGYIESSGGRRLAYALMVNDAGPIVEITDVSEVFDDQAQISNFIYESL